MLTALLAALGLLAAAVVLPPLWYGLRAPPPPELPPPGRRVELSPGVGVNVIEAGAGPPVLLVHGHPGCAYDWQPMLQELAARGYRAIAYDRVGYGRSDGRSPGKVTVEMNAGELLQLLAALDLRGVTLVGWSYGGGTSIAAARRDRSRIARIALVASVGPGIQTRTPLPGLLMFLFKGPVLAWISRVTPLALRLRVAAAQSAFHPSAVPDWCLVQGEALFARAQTRQAFRDEGSDLVGEANLDPHGIDLPMLVLQGRDDRVLPLAIPTALHARAERSELRLIADAGHMLPITHAALLADAIRDFAAGRPASLRGASTQLH